MFSRLTFLGTGAGMPSPARNVSAFALSFADGSAWLFDCGEGTQQQLMRCCGAAGQEASKRIGGEAPAGLSISRIKRIFITHLHGDHCLGLPGLVMTLAALRVRASAGLPPEGEGGGGSCEQQEQGPPAFAPFSEEAEYLEIVGPLGLARLLRGVLSSTDTGVLGFRYRVTELCDPPLGEAPRGEEALHASEAPVLSLLPDANGIYTIAVEPCGAAIRAAKLQHRVLCFGFAITEVTRPGALDAAKAMALGAKGPALGLLKAGKAVTLADGTTVQPEACVAPPQPGRTALLLGDSLDNSSTAGVPCAFLSLAEAQGAAVIVHEATFCEAQREHALPKGHSTARQAGGFAAELRAERLVLTHISQRYLPRSHSAEAAQHINAMEEEARDEVRARGWECAVRAVEDFEVVSLGRRA